MVASSGDRQRGRPLALKPALAIAVCALVVASCTSSSSDPAAAMQASESGDQKTAISLAKKDVARFSASDQCSPTTTLNFGTLALSYGSLAGYQILDGDTAAGELSFTSAKGALNRTAPANRASATAMVYRDVSEAFWKIGDQARAVAVLKEGRAAGGDSWLDMSSAARAAAQPPPASPKPAVGTAGGTPGGPLEGPTRTLRVP